MFDRTTYMHKYYSRNKHRKRYTYVKKGVMKRLTEAQYKILQILRKGHRMSVHFDRYNYFNLGLYWPVNTRSVECLISSKHVEIVGVEVRMTEKGINHKQSTPKKCKNI